MSTGILNQNDWRKTVDSIFKHYFSLVKEERIPALINTRIDDDTEEEMYLKLVLVPCGIRPTSTWIKPNLQKSSIIPFDSKYDLTDFCHNIVVEYNYKFNKRYAFNSHLLSDDEIVFVEQDGSDVACQVYNLYNTINKPNILQREKNRDVITLYFPAIKELIASDYGDCLYDLYVDFEYRIKLNEYTGEVGEFQTDTGLYSVGYSKSTPNEDLFYIMGSQKLDINNFEFETTKHYEISVVDLSTGKIRALNPKNYNDDTDAGLVVFDKVALKLLREYYYVYYLRLIPKTGDVEGVLIDVLDDCIVFWEGEFNGLPEEIKKALEKYNIKDKKDGIISDAMFSWQLEASWNFTDKLKPHQKLAYYFNEHYLQLCFENEMDFVEPENTQELKVFIEKTMKLLQLKIEDLNINAEKKNMLYDILKGKNIQFTKNDLSMFFEGFCYVLLASTRGES